MDTKAQLYIALSLIMANISPSIAQSSYVIKTTITEKTVIKKAVTIKKEQNSESRSTLKDFLSLSEKLKGYSYRNTPTSFQEYCSDYARLAVKQTKSRSNNRCENIISLAQGDLQRRWNLDPIPQYEWCLTVNSSRTGAEATYRERRLNDCANAQ